jgi:hypothetical protein
MRPPRAIQSAVLRVRGFALPDGGAVDLYADGDRWTTDPVANAELVAEGWLLPGLVDCHTHPGAETRGQPLDETVLREDLRQSGPRLGHRGRHPGIRPDLDPAAPGLMSHTRTGMKNQAAAR